MRFLSLTRAEPDDTAEPEVYIHPAKIVRLLRINPDGQPSDRSYTHVGYGLAQGNGSEICDRVKEPVQEILRRIRGAGKADPTANTL